MSESENNGDGSNLSIEETNKLRIKLGLDPLTEEKKQDFVHKPAHNIGDQKSADKARQKIIKHRENRELELNLRSNKPLSFDDAPLPDFNILAKKAEEMRRKKEVAQNDEYEDDDQNNELPYTGEDLQGLIVEHSSSRFDSYMPTILTLKDSNVLDYETGDVLQNVNFADHERYEENIKNQKTGVHYNAELDEEDDLMGAKPLNLLSKYDDDKKKGFIIGTHGNYDRTNELRDQYLQSTLLGKKINIPEKEVKIAADFYTPEELKSRLSTKRKRKARNTRTTSKVATVKVESNLEDIKPKKEEGELEEDNTVKTKKSKNSSDASSKKERAAPIVRTVESEDNEMDLRPNLVFSELTSVNPQIRCQMYALKQIKSKVKPLEHLLSLDDSDEDETKHPPTGLVLSSSSDNTDQILRKLKAQQESDAARQSSVKMEPVVKPPTVVVPTGPCDDVEMEEQAQCSGWQPEDKIVTQPKSEKRKQVKQIPSGPSQPRKPIKLTDGVLGDDVQLNKGVYSAMILAMNKGYLEQPKKESKLSNPRSDTLKAQHYYEEKIRYEDMDSKAPRRERHTGPVTSFQDKKDYKPDIKLEYNDEHGRAQEPKEAFRTLSHRFHGKSSGKIKCEKRDSRYKKEVTVGGALTGDVAMKSVDKQYSKMKEEKKFCVPLSGKNAIIPTSLKKMERRGEKKTGKTSPK